MTYESFIEQLSELTEDGGVLKGRFDGAFIRRKGWIPESEEDRMMVRSFNLAYGHGDADALEEDLLVLESATADHVKAYIRVNIRLLYRSLEKSHESAEDVIGRALDNLAQVPGNIAAGAGAWEEKKEHIFFYPIDDRTQAMAEDPAYFTWGDVRIGFALITDTLDGLSVVRVLVQNRWLALWEKTGEDLVECALANMDRRYAPRVRALYEVPGESGEQKAPEPGEEKKPAGGIWFLSNERMSDGAALSFLSPRFPQAVRDCCGEDVYLAFIGRGMAAVHLCRDTDPEVILDVVRTMDELPDDDSILSESIYRYELSTGRFYQIDGSLEQRPVTVRWPDGREVEGLGSAEKPL